MVHCALNMYSMESNLRIADVLGRAYAAARIRLVHVSTAAVTSPCPGLERIRPFANADCSRERLRDA
jgi:hypothetical protein